MNLNFWVIQAFNGISYGALLFLVGSGLSLIFGVMRIVNLVAWLLLSPGRLCRPVGDLDDGFVAAGDSGRGARDRAGRARRWSACSCARSASTRCARFC